LKAHKSAKEGKKRSEAAGSFCLDVRCPDGLKYVPEVRPHDRRVPYSHFCREEKIDLKKKKSICEKVRGTWGGSQIGVKILE